MANADSIRSTFSPSKTLAGGEEPCRSNGHWYDSSALSTPWVCQKALIVFCGSTTFEGLMHKYCSICAGPSSCPGSQSGIQSKDGRLFWWSRLWHASVMKSSPPHKYNKNYLHFHAFSMHPYWCSAKKRLCKVLKAFINTWRCERRLFEMRNTRVYNATPWKVLKCKTLWVVIPGSWFRHPLCTASPLWWTASRLMQCLDADCIILFTLIVARSLL
jgi:hypothetical protein